MADNTPEAPAEQPVAPASEATNTNTEQPAQPSITPEQVAEYLGTNKETLEKFTNFTKANGNFDTAFKKLRTDVSTPEPKAEDAPTTPPEPTQAPEQPKTNEVPTSPQTSPTPPAGAITPDEMMTKYYFEQLSKQDAYKAISKEIADGSLLKEMNALGIDIRNADGSFNDAKINTYLGIKAQTVPAQQPASEPDAATAPTVDYADIKEVTTMEQARTIIMQKGHPATEKAQEFIKKALGQSIESK